MTSGSKLKIAVWICQNLD